MYEGYTFRIGAYKMIIETIIWMIFTLLTVLFSALKTKHFMKEPGYRRMVEQYNIIKDKPTITKTMDDKKDYLRQRTENGKDFMTMIISTIIFLVGFFVLIVPRIENIYSGLISAFVFSLLFAWIFAKIQFTKHIYEYSIIDKFIGYLFASTFIMYVKFIEHIPTLLLLLVSIILMVWSNKYINRWVGNEVIKR